MLKSEKYQKSVDKVKNMAWSLKLLTRCYTMDDGRAKIVIETPYDGMYAPKEVVDLHHLLLSKIHSFRDGYYSCESLAMHTAFAVTITPFEFWEIECVTHFDWPTGREVIRRQKYFDDESEAFETYNKILNDEDCDRNYDGLKLYHNYSKGGISKYVLKEW